MRLPFPVRATTCALAATFLLAACDDGSTSTAPGTGATALAARNSAAMDTARTLVVAPTTTTRADSGRIVPSGEFSAWPFPASLALTEVQKTEIRTLRTNYQAAILADSNAAQAIYAEARAAQQAGRPREEINAILERARPIERRQQAQYTEYMAAIDRVFTAEQRAWLESYRRCLSGGLTPEQAAQVEALQQQYRTANAADIAAVQKALDDIMALRARPGADPATIEPQVRAILEGVLPARQRLAAAQVALAQQIRAVAPPRTCGG